MSSKLGKALSLAIASTLLGQPLFAVAQDEPAQESAPAQDAAAQDTPVASDDAQAPGTSQAPAPVDEGEPAPVVDHHLDSGRQFYWGAGVTFMLPLNRVYAVDGPGLDPNNDDLPDPDRLVPSQCATPPCPLVAYPGRLPENRARYALMGPGAGTTMRMGYEVGPFSIGAQGGFTVHSSSDGPPMTEYRAGLELKLTFNVGNVFVPTFGVTGGAFVVLPFDRGAPVDPDGPGGQEPLDPDRPFGLTGWGQAHLGGQFLLTPGIAIEVAVAFEIVAPGNEEKGAPFSDLAYFLTPQITLMGFDI